MSTPSTISIAGTKSRIAASHQIIASNKLRKPEMPWFINSFHGFNQNGKSVGSPSQ